LVILKRQRDIERRLIAEYTERHFVAGRSLSEMMKKWDKSYPRIKGKIDGLSVLQKVPNIGSISATFDDWEELSGIRKVPMREFGKPENIFNSSDDIHRSKELSERIRESGKISPLIVVIDDDGFWLLEGVHRYVALSELGVKSLPALVVIDHERMLRKKWIHYDLEE